jgi:hypothetical protein
MVFKIKDLMFNPAIEYWKIATLIMQKNAML